MDLAYSLELWFKILLVYILSFWWLVFQTTVGARITGVY